MRLTKSEFVEFSQCDKALWLRKNRPEAVAWPAPDELTRIRMRQGYEIEAVARDHVLTWSDSNRFSFQDEFETEDGLYARADIVRNNEDGTIDIYEVKSSTSLKDNKDPDHVTDAGFQTIVAERSGTPVRKVFIVHANKHYVRQDSLVPSELLVFEEVTQSVRNRYEALSGKIDRALNYLGASSINESFCDCRYKSRSNHCAAFSYFNSDIEEPSIYRLPNLRKAKSFAQEGWVGLFDVPRHELTSRQLKVLEAAEQGSPVINSEGITAFLDELEWPLYFYDYETYSTPVPQAQGHKPQKQLAVQFSVHRMNRSGDLTHSEFLTDDHGQQRPLVEALRTSLGDTGSLIAWNMKFERSCNTTLAELLPDHADFLNDMSRRTVDLMVPFGEDYVDIRFGGSQSIKEVLPVVCPWLNYDPDAVHDGGMAVAAWLEMVETADGGRRDQLRRELLDYCGLDTLAMVEIFKVLRETASA